MPKDCHNTAMSYLAHRERSSYELKSYLRSKGFQASEVEEELQNLLELHYVDDERYCEEYLQYGKRKGRGPLRLQQELKEKGIDSGLIQRVLEDHFDRQTEKDAAMREARKLIERKERTGLEETDEIPEETPDRLQTDRSEQDEKTIARIGRKLASLGYHTEIIYEVIGKIRKG